MLIFNATWEHFFHKTQWALQGVKLTQLMSILTYKNVWTFLIQIQLTKSNPKITRGVKVPCLMPIRVNTKTTHCTDDPSFYLDVQDAHYLIWQKILFDKKLCLLQNLSLELFEICLKNSTQSMLRHLKSYPHEIDFSIFMRFNQYSLVMSPSQAGLSQSSSWRIFGSARDLFLVLN